ncbi:phosphonate transport system substrate-binding protein [Rhodovulum iodosum]|uniref:Phosphonate transport system substrate-binding protein n=1 Tax=Rhodovulum iodosum TaxID=68291 RepID=A0ABV3XS38_9RHOB|nr:PhnD/SsuA/transferrin family substrate-binding protein [Rhodovulum robiginosum]RSK30484.1 phosphonate ABC transporter substrate-binding protein [Rhodovulum robiginosum]
MGPITFDRRRFVAAAAACALPRPGRATGTTFRLGLTPVFLDNDALVIEKLQSTFHLAMGRPIELVQRRTYQELTGLLLNGTVDAAWICGYPYLQHADQLHLVGVPVWRGRPLYRSYLIAAKGDTAAGLAELEGGSHAFSDPDSNSGWLVTASDLVRLGRTPEDFFDRTIFTYGHRNVVRAVASGLTRSGSVDGYVWEILAEVEPGLTGATRVVAKSEWLGFPPFAIRADRANEPATTRFAEVLRAFPEFEHGPATLRLLHLDGFAEGDDALFEGIAVRMRDVERLR